jgi:hypothetical protein
MSEETVQTQKSNSMIMGGIAVVVIALLAVGAFALKPSETPTPSASTNPTASTTVQASSVPSTAPASAASSTPSTQNGQDKLKVSTYEVDGNYTSPAGPESIGVKITLEGNIIKDSEVTVRSQHPISKQKQEAFAANYKTLVVGKNINDVKLDKVAGSSLTTKGFNDALEKVKEEAQS